MTALVHVLPWAVLGVAFVLLAVVFFLPDHRVDPDRFFGLTLPTGIARDAVPRIARIVAAARALVESRALQPETAAIETAADEADLLDADAAAAGAPNSGVVVDAAPPKSSHGGGSGSLPTAPTPAAGAVSEQHASAVRHDADEPAHVPRAEAQHGRDGRRIIWPRLVDVEPAGLSLPERLGIVHTLGAIAEDHVAPVLCEVLDQEDDPTIRDAALEAIRDARLSAAMMVLEDSLTVPRDRERVLAVEALGALGPAADPALFGALSDQCVAVVMGAAAALRPA